MVFMLTKNRTIRLQQYTKTHNYSTTLMNRCLTQNIYVGMMKTLKYLFGQTDTLFK